MKALICPQCAAEISLDENRDFGFCSYCGTKIQVNEKFIHHHEGEVSIEGLATVQTLCKKGFMEIDTGDFFAASKTFDKAAEIDCENILVSIGKMLTSCKYNDNEFNLFFYKKVLQFSSLISEEEIHIINEYNSKLFLKCYCYFGDKNRVCYIVEHFPESVSVDLINYKTNLIEYVTENNYLVKLLSKSNAVDVISLMIDHGIDICDIFDKLLDASLIHYEFVIDLFPLHILKKLATAGLTERKEFYDSLKRTDLLRKFSSYDYINVKMILGNKSDISEYKKYIEEIGRKKGCYIATAIYGSYDCSEVWVLRRFRDNILAKNIFGCLFIRIYYLLSPTFVKYFGNTAFFKTLIKPLLDKLVEQLKQNGIEDTPYND